MLVLECTFVYMFGYVIISGMLFRYGDVNR
jgi:hypothetical protein